LCEGSLNGTLLSADFFDRLVAQMEDTGRPGRSLEQRLDHRIGLLAGPAFIIRAATAIGGGGVRPAQVTDETPVDGIVNDAPGATIREDEGHATGSADAVGMVRRDAGACFECGKRGEGYDVVFAGGARFDPVKTPGILGDKANCGVGRGEVDGGV